MSPIIEKYRTDKIEEVLSDQTNKAIFIELYELFQKKVASHKNSSFRLFFSPKVDINEVCNHFQIDYYDILRRLDKMERAGLISVKYMPLSVSLITKITHVINPQNLTKR